MADDILDTAQKQINDAASAATGPVTPPEPAPEPVVPPPPLAEEAASLSETPVSVPPPPSTPPAKKSPKTAILAALLLLFITIPLTVYYVSQQQQLADVRSRAEDGPYPTQAAACSGCAQKNYRWELRGGECKKVYDKSCDPNSPPPGQSRCTGYGAAGCDGSYPGASCGEGGECVMSDRENGGCSCQGQGGEAPTNPPATSRPTSAPQCQNIKIYKDNAVVNPSTLRAGDQVVLAVKGNGATQGRIRVNGGTFTVTTTKNASDEYTVNFTIPTTTTTFTVEAEVFIDGAWR